MTLLMQEKLSFIETQFPVSKLTKEALKERRSNTGQTLTGMGKWWGRKQLIIVRASILGMLMPSSEDPKKDQDIFLKILTMDDDALWDLRCDPSKAWTCNLTNKSNKEIEFEHALPSEKDTFFEVINGKPRWLTGSHLNSEDRPSFRDERKKIFHKIFLRLPYEYKLKYCDRPEAISGPSLNSWNEINDHLGTSAFSLTELVDELGKKRFGHTPRLADPFCGGGSIPFEASRIGCEVMAGDISPAAALLTWVSMNVLGGDKNLREKVLSEIQIGFDEMAAEISTYEVERRSDGAKGYVYFYCNEILDPNSGWLVPLASNWVIDAGTGTYAKLIPNKQTKKFEIEIVDGGSAKDLKDAKLEATWRNGLRSPVDRDGNWISPEIRVPISAESLRGSRGLRHWEASQIIPSSEDKFQERLFCIRWAVPEILDDGSVRYRREYASPTKSDFDKEKFVIEILEKNFQSWQNLGFMPSARIIPGSKTDEPTRTRGWTYWHQLFLPRQLLLAGLFLEKIFSKKNKLKETMATALLTVGRFADWNCKLCIITLEMLNFKILF